MNLRLMRSALALFLLAALAVSASGSANPVQAEDQSDLPYMQPDGETFEEWMRAYDSTPLTTTSTLPMVRSTASEPGGSLSLLPHIDYVPSERNQGSCGNCWAWAGTGCMEITLDTQESIHERLSVQYINSCQGEIIGKPCCNGGWLSDVDNFYDVTGRCIPWSNDGAHWQDGDGSCDTPCDTISKEPYYDITSIDVVTIPTHADEGVASDAEAISNIKSVLDSGHGIWFAFFTSSYGEWTQFTDFWLYGSEDSVCDLDSLCDGSTLGPAHAVLCVGYNDSVAEDYWLMLNSWGTANSNRPDGTFRVEMDMDYDTTNAVPAFYWQTLDVEFSAPDPPVISTDFAAAVEEDTAILFGTLVSDSGSAAECRFEYSLYGDNGTQTTPWQSGVSSGDPFEADVAGLLPGTRYEFRAQAVNIGGTSEGEPVIFRTKPLEPTELDAAASGQTIAELAWTKGQGSSRTIVRGKRNSVPTDPSDGYAVYDGDGTSCSDEGLEPGSTYWYAAWSVADDEIIGEVSSDEFASDNTTTIGNGVWMEGDVNLDAKCNIVDAMFVAQYTVGLRELDEIQMMCADTTDDGTVNIVDAMHIAQFTVDPDMTNGILFRLVWESPADDGMLDPLGA